MKTIWMWKNIIKAIVTVFLLSVAAVAVPALLGVNLSLPVFFVIGLGTGLVAFMAFSPLVTFGM